MMEFVRTPDCLREPRTRKRSLSLDSGFSSPMDLTRNHFNNSTPPGLHANQHMHQKTRSCEDVESMKKMEAEYEFAIAADLTLYANPLRCLKKTASSSATKPAAPKQSHSHSAGSEMIAADLVKYGSPLDDKPN